MTPGDICSLCKNKSTNIVDPTNSFQFIINCACCGKYVITYELQQDIPSYKLTSDETVAIIGFLRNTDATITLTNDNINELRKQNIPNPFRRSEMLIKLIAVESEGIGKFVKYNEEKWQGQSYSKDRQELDYLLNEYLVTLGYLKNNPALESYMLTPKGWEHIATLSKKQINSKLVFCAMWFNDSTNILFVRLKDVIEKCGYEAIRVDKIAHNNKICDEIIANIKKCKFMIADLTGHRGGVYYEAGFGVGIGIPVIYTCKEKERRDMHFDIRQYNCITWEDSKLDEFCIELENRIIATIN